MDVELLHQYDLTVLSVNVNHRGRKLRKDDPGSAANRGGQELRDGDLGPAAVYEVWRGSEEPVILARVPTPEETKPGGAAPSAGEADFAPPREVLTAPALARLASEGEPIWLDLPATAGPLRLMPWERLLAPLGVPVLRLPSLLLPSRPSEAMLQVALCASSIPAEGDDDWVRHVVRLAKAIVDSTTRPLAVHVFTNCVHVAGLQESLGEVPQVTIHDPGPEPTSRPSQTRRAEALSTVENPWLLWMQERLVGVAVDHIHFLCHGDFVLDHGSVAFATTPWTTGDGYRCVGPPELLALLTGVGAWSVGLSGPAGNISAPGLLDVAYSINDAQPGPVVQHEIVADADFADLSNALSLCWNDRPSPAPRTASTAIWAHPASVSRLGSRQSSARSQRPEKFAWEELPPATDAALASAATPTWVAATARVLEQAGAQWLAGSTTSGRGLASLSGSAEPVDRPAAVEALQFAAELLDSHVRDAGESGQRGRRPT